MERTYNMEANEILFKLSDIYNQEQIDFTNCIGENLFGKLILNRVETIAYMKLLKNSNTDWSVYKKNFELMYKQKMDEISDYEEYLAYVCRIMEEANFNFAFLKGAFLITNVYEKGLRYSNDIDILIDERDIDECQRILLENGFVQGYAEHKKIHKASRREIVLSRMNYGETIPFCKLFGNRFIFVDINFSLDYKPAAENKIIQNMLQNTVQISWKNSVIRTLNISDFIIHLCMHLYKEATTWDWVRRRKDLNLYKFNDINVVFHECVNGDKYEQIKEKIINYGVQNECYYAFLYASKIYKGLLDEEKYGKLLEDIKPKDTDYLCEIIDPERKKTYKYNMSFEEWFACEDRVKQLYEV